MQESHTEAPLEQVKQLGGHLEHTVELKVWRGPNVSRHSWQGKYDLTFRSTNTVNCYKVQFILNFLMANLRIEFQMSI